MRQNNWKWEVFLLLLLGCVAAAVAALLLSMVLSAVGLILSATLAGEAAQPTAPPETVLAAVEEPEPGFPYREDVPLDETLQEVLWRSCAEAGVPYEVGLGLIETESGFQADAVSPAGCYGYCQLNPRYFPAGLDGAENIRAGMTYLAECVQRYDGDLAAGLTAYNAGHDTGRRGYAGRVLTAAERWEVVRDAGDHE